MDDIVRANQMCVPSDLRVAVALVWRPLARASEGLTRRWRAAAEHRSMPIICFAWAVGEATVWPVIPDVALFVALLAAPRRAPGLFAATLCGAAVGGCVTVSAAVLAPHHASSLVMHVPLVHGGSVPVVRSYLESHTLLQSFLFQPWSGIPFKLWAVTAVTTAHASPAVIPAFVFGRSIRFAAVAIVGASLGASLRRALPVVSVPLVAAAAPAGLLLFYRIAIAG